MPSWNEKPHVTPTINVNLAHNPRDPHTDESKVLIPCNLPPSFTCEVVLGECICGGHIGRGPPAIIDRRSATCPGRPISVSCSIAGDTWDASEVDDAWPTQHDFAEDMDGMDWPEELAACRDRWALVKALVMGNSAKDLWLTMPESQTSWMVGLVSQRDAVFSALVRMERGNTEVLGGIEDFDKALTRRKRTSPIESISGPMLTYYVQHLIEQVGAIS
jgi:hypothetical protein